MSLQVGAVRAVLQMVSVVVTRKSTLNKPPLNRTEPPLNGWSVSVPANRPLLPIGAGRLRTDAGQLEFDRPHLATFHQGRLAGWITFTRRLA